MPEIDLRLSPWNPGIPIEATTVSRDLYLLIAIFSASPELSKRRVDDDDEATVYGYSIRHFERTEVGRIIVSLSAIGRNDWDSRPDSIEEVLRHTGQSAVVGRLLPDRSDASNAKALKIRDSWNKVLHCHTFNFERSKGPTTSSGHLEPQIHLYGELNGKEWKASIDVFRWAEVMHALT